jgi:predicted ribosomally synthesized peptide with SipW-like signal peptide
MSNDTQFSISRRKVLAGLGTIGIASAGAGLGTTAFFSDEEAVTAELQAGRLDLLVDFRATYEPWLGQAATDAIVNGPAYAVPGDDMTYVVGQAPDWRDENDQVLTGEAWAAATLDIDACEYENTIDIREEIGEGQFVNGTPNDMDDSFYPGYVDGDEGLMFSLNDVKPKDEGEATISLHLCDNPAYVGVEIDSTGMENGVVEPESSAGDSMDEDGGELANFIYVRFWLDSDCSNTYSDDETMVYQGSLAGLQAAVNAGDSPFVDGLQISGACLDPGVHCVAFDWYFVCEPEDFDKVSDAANAETLGDEIRAALGLAEDEEIEVNVAQTDTLDFGLSFNAVQCRHNMEMCEIETGEGFGKPAEFESGTESLFARARYGNNANNGAEELRVGEAPPNNADTIGQYAWTSGATVNWEYVYDPSSGSTWTFDGVTLTEDSTPTLADEIVIQTKAQSGTSVSVTLDEFADAGGNVVSLSGPKTVTAEGTAEGRDLQYLLVPECSGVELNDGFSMSGTAVVTVDSGVSVSDEGVAFDINVE